MRRRRRLRQPARRRSRTCPTASTTALRALRRADGFVLPGDRATPSSTCRWPSLSIVLGASPASCSPTCTTRRALGACTASPSATRLRRAGYTVPREQVLPRLALHRRHRALRQGPDRPGRLLVQPERPRRRRQRRRRERGRRTVGWVYRTSTRRWSTASSTAPASVPEDAGQCPAPHADRHGPAVRRPASSPVSPCSPACSSCRSSERVRGAESDDRLPERLGPDPRHLPAAGGCAGDDGDPQERRRPASRSVALVTSAGRRRGRRRCCSSTSTTTTRASCSSWSTSSGSTSSTPLHHRHRRHLAAAAHADAAASCRWSSSTRWNHFPEPHNPKAFLTLILILETGMVGHVRRPGPDPLLRLLRGRPAPDVLHDRRVGRRAAPVRLDQVLPLHAVRLGADDRRLPGAVLPVQGPVTGARETFDMRVLTESAAPASPAPPRS